MRFISGLRESQRNLDDTGNFMKQIISLLDFVKVWDFDKVYKRC